MNFSSRLKTVRLHQDIIFGLDGNDAPYLGEGWAEAELGRRWSEGGASEIRFIHPGNVDVFLEIDAFPMILTPVVASQHIEVQANGAAVGTIEMQDSRRRALHIPAGRIPPGQFLTLRLMMPDATRTADYGSGGDKRVLGVCFSRLSLFTLQAPPSKRSLGTGGVSLSLFAERTGVAADAGLGCFEGLGEIGEFALVQARIGVKPPALLLSAAIGLPQLLRGLDAGFAELGEPGSYDVKLSPTDPVEYAVIDRNYAAEFRSTQTVDEIKLSEFMLQQGARLRDLRRSLMQMVTSGDRIFVFVPGKGGPALTEHEVLPLLIALNRHGPNWLLWITEADSGHPPGTVAQTAPFLLRGSIDRLQADAHAKNISIDIWLELCANALAIARPAALAAHLRTDRQVPIEVTEKVTQAATVRDAEPVPARLVAAAESPAPVGPAPALPATLPAESEYSVLQKLNFGEGGNEEAALGFGWAGPEPGYRWTEGASCELWLDHPGQRNVVVTIEAWPLVMPPAVEVQRAEVSAHDARLATLTFTVPARKAVYIPTTSLRPGRILRLRCALPDAARPCDVIDSEDDRQLGLGFIRVAIQAVSGRADERRLGSGGITAEDAQMRTGLPPDELFGQFEALAGSQAFLEVQGVFGVAPQSLFRSGTLQLIDLVRAVDARFAGLGDPAHLTSRLYEESPEIHEIIDDAIKLSFLAERAVSDTTTDMLLARQSRRLKFLRDQLLYDFSTGEKIFVYHRLSDEAALTEADMLPLLIALRQQGPCTLLFATQEDSAHPAGTVERMFPGLLHGYLAGTDAGDFTTQNVWLEICANALALKGGS